MPGWVATLVGWLTGWLRLLLAALRGCLSA